MRPLSLLSRNCLSAARRMPATESQIHLRCSRSLFGVAQLPRIGVCCMSCKGPLNVAREGQQYKSARRSHYKVAKWTVQRSEYAGFGDAASRGQNPQDVLLLLHLAHALLRHSCMLSTMGMARPSTHSGRHLQCHQIQNRRRPPLMYTGGYPKCHRSSLQRLQAMRNSTKHNTPPLAAQRSANLATMSQMRSP